MVTLISQMGSLLAKRVEDMTPEDVDALKADQFVD